jgi:deoxyribodipyrimidine photo-lyase
MEMKNKETVNLFWFRRDLRLEDNAGLYQALKSGIPVLPVFIFDKDILDKLEDKDDKRVAFIHMVLENIQSQLNGAGSTLLVLHDHVDKAFEQILSRFEIKAVFTNHDYEPYAIQRDLAISEMLKSRGVEFHSFKDQVIFERSEVMKADGTPYTVFTPYSRIWKQKFREQRPVVYPSEKLLASLHRINPIQMPTLKKMGFEDPGTMVVKPEISKNIMSNYESTRNIPSVNGTTRLSVHLRFGTVSVRKLALLASDLSETWLNELIWREFFMMILFHFPHVVNRSFKMKYENIRWRNNEEEFDKWCKGETGYPIVDAGMRELNETGFMHNRVRMVVASFLTKHLLIDWRWGEAYFARKLMDFELSSNNGNWQWAAGCGCDAAPYFRVFNPSEQTKKFDPEFKYIKRWLGDMKEYDIMPVVQHEIARKRALEVYKAAVGSE